MRRDVVDDLLFYARFADETDTTLREVAQPAVQQAARAAAGPEGEVVLLDEADSQPAHRGIARNAGADDAAPDDEDVERLGAESLNGLQPCGCGALDRVHPIRSCARAALREEVSELRDVLSDEIRG